MSKKKGKKAPKTLFSIGDETAAVESTKDELATEDLPVEAAVEDLVAADETDGTATSEVPPPPPPPPPPGFEDGDASVNHDGLLFCPECGAERVAGAVFCGECGTSLAEDVPEEVEAPVVDVPEPAATLYADGGSFEPLPPEPDSGFHVAAPAIGVVAGGVVEEGEGDHTPVDPEATGTMDPVSDDVDAVSDQDTIGRYAPYPPAVDPGGPTGAAGSGSKKGLLIGAAAVVFLLIVGGVALAVSGGKSGDKVETAAPASTTTTTKRDEGSSTATSKTDDEQEDKDSSSTTTSEPEAPTTSTTAMMTTTTTIIYDYPTQPTVAPAPVPVPTAPTVPARIRVSPAGGEIRIAKHGSFTISMANDGGVSGQYQVTANGLAGSTSGSLGAGQSTSVVISDTAGIERGLCSVSVSVVAAGSPSVKICVTVG